MTDYGRRRGIAALSDHEEIDVLDFCQHHTKILTEAGTVEHPTLRATQLRIHEAIEEQRARRGLVRLLIGKFRKPGASTYIQLRYLCHAVNDPNLTVVTAAHREDSTNWIYSIGARAYRHLPDELKARAPLQTTEPTAKGMKFAAPFEGQYLVRTAGGAGFGHGITPQRVHLSEPSQYERGAEFFGGLGNSLRGIPGTEIIWETTFNGRDDFFWPEWERAGRGEGEYERLFLGLMEEEKNEKFYSIPMLPGEKLDLRPDEEALQKKYSIPDDLMKFVVQKKNSAECAYRWDIFHQQFPLVEELAVTTLATDVFDVNELRRQLRENVEAA